MIPIVCGILQKDTNELLCVTETDSQALKTNIVTKGDGWCEGGIDWGFGIGICIRSIWNDYPTGTCCIEHGNLHNLL